MEVAPALAGNRTVTMDDRTNLRIIIRHGGYPRSRCRSTHAPRLAGVHVAVAAVLSVPPLAAACHRSGQPADDVRRELAQLA
jgi:hypothetical protein